MNPRQAREVFTAAVCVLTVMASASSAETGENSLHSSVMVANAADLRVTSDSVRADTTIPVLDTETHSSRNIWGLDILLSNNGFGLGASYRREFTEDLSGFLNFSISESKDEREVERYDYFGNVYVPGKLSRFLVMPLMAGVQYRLFREDITETFRPYINAGAGPTLIYASPFAEFISDASGLVQIQQVEFFKSLGRGQPHYTVGAFVGKLRVGEIKHGWGEHPLLLHVSARRWTPLSL
jgi:hypothetical protein